MGNNCIASTSIGCLFCLKGCNAEKVRNAFTFVPPKPSYIIEADPEDEEKYRMSYLLEALYESNLYRKAIENCEVRFVTTRKGNRIPLVWLRSEKASTDRSPLVLLHCHGNATDIGFMMGPYYELAKHLDIEVVGVEYSGYGMASGKPSANNTQADLEAAYDLLFSLGVAPSRIVAYGQSVGSGPVTSLATKRKLAGIVLHSPLLSGIRIIDPEPARCCTPSCVWACFDFYPNHRMIRNVSCPVFIMHGQIDNVIPFYHGRWLHEACPPTSRYTPYFPPRASHNDLLETDKRTYYCKVAKFLGDVKCSLGCQDTTANVVMDELVSQGQPGVPRASHIEATILGDSSCTAGAGTFFKEVREPAAGPEDGRYEQMRQGKVKLPRPEGGARDLQAMS